MADYEPRGITVRDVAAADFIKAYAEHLKNTGRVELPAWCDLVKTAPHKEMCPYDQDWYYIRAGEEPAKGAFLFCPVFYCVVSGWGLCLSGAIPFVSSRGWRYCCVVGVHST